MASGQNAGAEIAPALQIAMTDSGPGIPAEFRERVFDEFFWVEHHLGRERTGVRGTGIGLYLCREVVKAHGDTLTCEPGDGGSARGLPSAFLSAREADSPERLPQSFPGRDPPPLPCAARREGGVPWRTIPRSICSR
jgi:signal transduction histidine kinase